MAGTPTLSAPPWAPAMPVSHRVTATVIAIRQKTRGARPGRGAKAEPSIETVIRRNGFECARTHQFDQHCPSSVRNERPSVLARREYARLAARRRRRPWHRTCFRLVSSLKGGGRHDEEPPSRSPGFTR